MVQNRRNKTTAMLEIVSENGCKHEESFTCCTCLASRLLLPYRGVIKKKMHRSWHIRLPNPARGRREEIHKVRSLFFVEFQFGFGFDFGFEIETEIKIDVAPAPSTSVGPLNASTVLIVQQYSTYFFLVEGVLPPPPSLCCQQHKTGRNEVFDIIIDNSYVQRSLSQAN